MNRQQIFDKVVSSLREQGKAYNSEEDVCMYLTPDGKKCAAGQLIDPEHYIPKMEGASLMRLSEGKYYNKDWRSQHPIRDCNFNYTDYAKSMMIAEALVKSGVPEEDLVLVANLQGIHDDEKEELWEQEWQKLADKYSLTMPEA